MNAKVQIQSVTDRQFNGKQGVRAYTDVECADKDEVRLPKSFTVRMEQAEAALLKGQGLLAPDNVCALQICGVEAYQDRITFKGSFSKLNGK